MYTKKDLESARSKDYLQLECSFCKKSFYRTKRLLMSHNAINNPNKYCSKECNDKAKTKKIKFTCSICKKEFLRHQNQAKKYKNHFCSSSCAAVYGNTHRKNGYKLRSKLEVWLESKLPSMYPNLQFLFNEREVLGLELDIYLPSLKLAFELNGIFHYEPIFGNVRFSKIQNNDSRKFQSCIENKISLCIIDVSHQKYFKESTSVPFLNIICKIIDQNLTESKV